jgi:hypothetical protein
VEAADTPLASHSSSAAATPSDALGAFQPPENGAGLARDRAALRGAALEGLAAPATGGGVGGSAPGGFPVLGNPMSRPSPQGSSGNPNLGNPLPRPFPSPLPRSVGSAHRRRGPFEDPLDDAGDDPQYLLLDQMRRLTETVN